MKLSKVSKHAKMSQKRERNWTTMKTNWVQQGAFRRSRGHRQWEDRQNDKNNNEGRNDTVHLVDDAGNCTQKSDKHDRSWVADLQFKDIPVRRVRESRRY